MDTPAPFQYDSYPIWGKEVKLQYKRLKYVRDVTTHNHHTIIIIFCWLVASPVVSLSPSLLDGMVHTR